MDIQDPHQNHGHGLDGLKQAQVVVVMVPLPAQGHLNQLLQLSRIISSYDVPVYYLGSATHNRQAKIRVHGWDPLMEGKLQFHDFPTPHFHCPASSACSQFPAHMQSFLMETTKLRQPVAAFLRELSSTAGRLVVIHDPLMAAVIQDVASIPNAESYIFQCVSAFTTLTCAWEAAGKPALENAEIPEDIPPLFTSFSMEFLSFIGYQMACQKINCGTLHNTTRAIEGTYLDLLDKQELNDVSKKRWAIGPVNPLEIHHNQNSKPRHKCLEWLDKQAPKSVLYVSFGTTTSLVDEQIKEIALGLEESTQKFIWVLRDADRGDIFSGEVRIAELPQGYEQRIEAAGMGMVVRDWAPQVEILGHASTGGFMSHCGWNSCLESISMGVPIAAWPMHSDQPRNAVLITQVLNVGLPITKETQELVTSSAIQNVVRRLMASEEGDDLRKRTADLGVILKMSLDVGGASRMELDSFIVHITR